MLSRLLVARCAVVLFCASTTIPAAHAQWTQDGSRIGGAFGGGVEIADVQRYSHGGFVALVPGQSLMDLRWMDGDGVDQWNVSPANNPFVYQGPNSFGFSGASMATVPSGDIYVGWTDLQYNSETFQTIATSRVQRLDASKAVLWDPEGMRVFPNSGSFTNSLAACAGASNDVIIAAVEFDSVQFVPRRLRLQRLLADSTRAWGPGGVVLEPVRDLPSFVPPAMQPDGAGGVYILWPEYSVELGEWDYRVQHVSAAGVAQWPAGGVLATTMPGSSPISSLLSDGAGGAYVVVKANSSEGSMVQAQRLTPAGTRLYGANGVELAGPATATSTPHSAFDADAQGLRLAWVDLAKQLRTRRFSAANGSALFTSAVLNQPLGGTTSYVGLQAVAGANGETTVSWSLDGADSRVMAQRLSASGAILWNQGGIVVCAPPGETPFTLFMIRDENDGVYCVFRRINGFVGSWFAMRIDADGDLRMLSGTITAAADVPADQGGALAITYRAPSTDAGFNLPEITGYNVWRLTTGLSAAQATALEPASEEDALAALASSIAGRLKLTPAQALRLRFPPGTWESLGFQSAVLDSQYRFIVPTRNDSGPLVPNADETFVVTAHTSSPSTFGISNAVNAHSRDNLAPAAPQQLAGALVSGTMRLTWAANGEADLGGYRVYRGAGPGFTPSPATLRGFAGLGAYDDGPFAPGSWYKVTAIDWHGNESLVAVLPPTAVTDAESQPAAHFDFLRTLGANPVRGDVAVEFGLRVAGHARVTVLDAQGRVTAVLADGPYEADAHRVAWSRRGARAGLYFVRVEAVGFVGVRKVVVGE